VSGEQVVYQYDTLNRLIQAQAASNSWGQQYVYDGFGNLYQKNVTAGSAPSMSLVVDPTTNRLTNTGGTAFTYDANGNESGGPNVAGVQGYDFLNPLASSYVTYCAYDASNRRIFKGTVQSQSISEVYYLYGLDGENLELGAPTAPQRPWRQRTPPSISFRSWEIG
jgi:YD repeat-containing protein